MGGGYIWDALESFTATPFLWRSLEYGVEMFYCYDANKNVVSVIDGHENIMCQYEYSPFGEGLSWRGYLVNNQPFGFSAEYKDEETGLICFNYRESLPHYGNWTTRDPIAERGGINLYLFSRNSPINYVDVNGQFVWAIPIAGLVGGAIVGVGCQLFRDTILGVPPLWEDYVGAALSGGMVGAVAMLSPGMAMWARAGMGAISAGLGNITSQELKIHVSETATEVDYADFAVASSVGAVFTFVKANKVIGLNSGRNSSLALAKSISTKAKNGSISSVKSKTLIKAWDGVRQDFGFQDGWKQNIITGVSDSVVSFIVLIVSGEDDCGNAVDILYKEERRYEK
jgi:RHS repeat-associated protein